MDLKICQKMLPKVSRTFALGINALGQGELHKSTLVGYLFCRVIDTIEDDKILSPDLKQSFLVEFNSILKKPQAARIEAFKRCLKDMSPKEHDEALIRNMHHVFQVFQKLSFKSQSILEKWVTEMSEGMAYFVSKYPNGLRIQNLNELKKYCYYVAGTVGHLLTDLWQEHSLLITKLSYIKLKDLAEPFGEALQLTNILKDVVWDFKEENAIYIPQEILIKHGSSQKELLNFQKSKETRLAFDEVLSVAKEDLSLAIDYIRSLPYFSLRIRMFCIVPIILAIPTLKKLSINHQKFFYSEENVKLTREEVRKIISQTWKIILNENRLKQEIISLDLEPLQSSYQMS